MKYFLDTEFHEDGDTIDLISIGIVDEDERDLYIVNADCDFDRIWTLDSCQWLRENVMPSIDMSLAVPRCDIRDSILRFVSIGFPETPEFWGYYADYDWVVFCQLFGRMIDLPPWFPKFCMDIKQLAVQKGNPRLLPCRSEHNALCDAKWNLEAYKYLSKLPWA